MPQHWSDSEKKFVLDNAGRLKDHEIASILSRVSGRHISRQAVIGLRARLGVKKAQGRGYCIVVSRPTASGDSQSGT